MSAHQQELPEGKLALFWIIGALCMLLGSWLAGHLERVLGITDASFYGTLFIAFLLFLFGGLAWIAVAVGVAQHGKAA
ncbi:MAG: hypothetical protein ABIF85_01315 [Nanoarchaeota archaeon]|nr:hypothetical protein [Nanoarchaeota archaeon]MBU4451548.1 hypothetical protein [Nanoarchaeota archaeon]MCG2724033.1 hypothetical protein [archaeon]